MRWRMTRLETLPKTSGNRLLTRAAQENAGLDEITLLSLRSREGKANLTFSSADSYRQAGGAGSQCARGGGRCVISYCMI